METATSFGAPPKLYYSIREVAQMFHINIATLRFWETQFDILRPHKTDKGTRLYRQGDVEAVRLIYHLVKERGMTLSGARRKLKENKSGTVRQEEIVHRLKQIRAELQELEKAFDLIEPEAESIESQTENK